MSKKLVYFILLSALILEIQCDVYLENGQECASDDQCCSHYCAGNLFGIKNGICERRVKCLDEICEDRCKLNFPNGKDCRFHMDCCSKYCNGVLTPKIAGVCEYRPEGPNELNCN